MFSKMPQSPEVSLGKLSVVLFLVVLLSIQFYVTGYSYYGFIQPPVTQSSWDIFFTFSYFSSVFYLAVFVLVWLKSGK